MNLFQISLREKGEFPENGFLLNEKKKNSYPLKYITNLQKKFCTVYESFMWFLYS